MPHLPAEIILVFTPLAPLFSARVWRRAHVVRLGALLTPGVRTVCRAGRSADTPWEDVDVDWYGGQRLGFCIALWTREEVEAYLQEHCGMEEAARRDNEAQFPPAGVCERSLAYRRPQG
jgi:hypothetical protein